MNCYKFIDPNDEMEMSDSACRLDNDDATVWKMDDDTLSLLIDYCVDIDRDESFFIYCGGKLYWQRDASTYQEVTWVDSEVEERLLTAPYISVNIARSGGYPKSCNLPVYRVLDWPKVLKRLISSENDTHDAFRQALDGNSRDNLFGEQATKGPLCNQYIETIENRFDIQNIGLYKESSLFWVFTDMKRYFIVSFLTINKLKVKENNLFAVLCNPAEQAATQIGETIQSLDELSENLSQKFPDCPIQKMVFLLGIDTEQEFDRIRARMINSTVELLVDIPNNDSSETTITPPKYVHQLASILRQGPEAQIDLDLPQKVVAYLNSKYRRID